MADLHWFPFYAADWLSSAAVAAMLPEQEGAYLHLLSVAWGDGSREPTLPDDRAYLAQMSRLGARWKKLGPLVRAQFVVGADGRLVNEKLLGVWQEQQLKHAKASAKASTGGKAKAARRRARSSAPSSAPGVLQADSEQCLEGAPDVQNLELEGAVPGALTRPKVLAPPPDGALAPAGAAPRAPGGTADTAPTEAELVAERERRGEEPRTASARLPVVSQHGSRPEDVLAHVEFTAERRRREAEYFAELKTRAEVWIADHPDEVGDLELDVRDEQGLADRRELTDWQRTAVREAVYERVREVNGWPDSERWIAEHRTSEPSAPEPAGAA